jgi:hypothetical protein
MPHKFHVGESVILRPASSRNVPGGVYEVTFDEEAAAPAPRAATQQRRRVRPAIPAVRW